jgi:GR25 family glycosyltransferase involved in LPS biosynthesis
MANLFEHTLFINLEHRTDRLEHALSEFKKMNINAERVNAIRPKSGAVGCTMSHIKCLELAKKREYEYVFICEDDITFTNPELLKENIQKFVDNKEIQWDILIIGGNNVPPYQQLTNYCARVFNCQTTTGYVVKKSFYDPLIQNFKEGVQQLVSNPSNAKMFALDIYWKRLQMQYFWYMITPPTVTQYENYSDIENKQTNYDHLLLDMDKPWLFQQRKMNMTMN